MHKPDSAETICTFPWEMYSIDTAFGLWRVCPRNKYKQLNDLNFHNHEEIIQQRKDIRSGIKNKACSICWEDQEQGAQSFRQSLGQNHFHPLSTLDTVKVPEILEIKFSNICNLKCVFCSSKCSSLWEKVDPFPAKNMGRYYGDSLNRKLIQYIKNNYKDIKRIQLFGGEPLLTNEFDEIFDLILNAPSHWPKKIISFSTNMFYPKKNRPSIETKIGRVLDQGHKLHMRFSMDGVGEQCEYQRTNLAWPHFEENLNSFLEQYYGHPNFGQLRCNIALNIINLVYLDTILDFLVKKSWLNIEPHYNYVGRPEHFYIKSFGSRLTKAHKIIQSQNFHHYKKYNAYVLRLVESMVNIPPNMHAINKCKNWLDNYDNEHNGKNFLDLFPLNSYMFDN
jgi:sulfatase maturation enzyme AslB (radical SAM superfamily)